MFVENFRLRHLAYIDRDFLPLPSYQPSHNFDIIIHAGRASTVIPSVNISSSLLYTRRLNFIMMLSPMRSLILAIPFALVATLFSAPGTRASALALPGPFPMPFRNADYNGHLASLPHTASPDLGKKYAAAVSGHTSDERANASLAHHEYPARTGSLTLRAFRRGVSDLDAMLEGLGSYRDDATTDSEELRKGL